VESRRLVPLHYLHKEMKAACTVWMDEAVVPGASAAQVVVANEMQTTPTL